MLLLVSFCSLICMSPFSFTCHKIPKVPSSLLPPRSSRSSAKQQKLDIAKHTLHSSCRKTWKGKRERGSMLETLNFIAKEKSGTGAEPPASLARAKGPMTAGRAVINPSAASMERFGGNAFWRSQLKQLLPHQKHDFIDDIKLMKIKQQTINLDIDFIVKEREKIDVLKELEINKRIANDLMLKLPKESSKAVQVADRINSDISKLHLIPDAEKMRLKYLQKCASSLVLKKSVRQSPSLILMELQQAKMNLASSTCGISGIRASIVLIKSMIAKEEALLEKSRERLRLNTAIVLSLEENLRKSTTELKLIKDAKSKHQTNSESISNQITKLGLEKEDFTKIAEGSKADSARLISDIEQIKTGVKAAEAAEAALLAEKASISHNHPQKDEHELSSRVTLSLEEYALLICKARRSDEKSKRTIETAMARVRAASQSNHSLHMKVEEAIAEVGASRKALKEAHKREEAANREKLAAEEALQRWISKQNNNICAMATAEVESNRQMLKEALEREELENRGKLVSDENLQWWSIKKKHKIRYVQNSTKFKNYGSVPHRTETGMFDLNGMSLIATGKSRRLSIGQILSIKLMDIDEYEKEIREKTIERPRISLGQLLSQRHQLMSPTRTNVNNVCTRFSRKRRKFGFICLSHILAKQSKNRKNQRQRWSPQSNCRALLV